MKTIAESHGMDEPANGHFGFRIFRAHRRHHLRTLLRLDMIHQPWTPPQHFLKVCGLFQANASKTPLTSRIQWKQRS